jgi:hypothetical protein
VLLKGFIDEVTCMELSEVVKYVNITYAGIMLGLAAYFIVLIKYGYTFVPGRSISITQLFSTGTLGPAVLGVIPVILAVMIILTIVVVLLNMVYENTLKMPPKVSERRHGERERRRGRR